jgi:hypothetical protein
MAAAAVSFLQKPIIIRGRAWAAAVPKANRPTHCYCCCCDPTQNFVFFQRLDLSENSGLYGDLGSLLLTQDDATEADGNVAGDDCDDHRGSSSSSSSSDNDGYSGARSPADAAAQSRADPKKAAATVPAAAGRLSTALPCSGRAEDLRVGLAGCLQGLDLHETLVGGLLAAAVAQLSVLRWLDVRSTQCRGTLHALVRGRKRVRFCFLNWWKYSTEGEAGGDFKNLALSYLARALRSHRCPPQTQGCFVIWTCGTAAT